MKTNKPIRKLVNKAIKKDVKNQYEKTLDFTLPYFALNINQKINFRYNCLFMNELPKQTNLFWLSGRLLRVRKHISKLCFFAPYNNIWPK